MIVDVKSLLETGEGDGAIGVDGGEGILASGCDSAYSNEFSADYVAQLNEVTVCVTVYACMYVYLLEYSTELFSKTLFRVKPKELLVRVLIVHM